MSLSDTSEVRFSAEVHAAAGMTLIEASRDTSLRGSQRFFLEEIILPTLENMLAFCDSDKARSMYTEHKLESSRIWARKNLVNGWSVAELTNRFGWTFFSPADFLDMSFNMGKNGSQFHMFNVIKSARFADLDELGALGATRDIKIYSPSQMHYTPGREVSLLDLGAWYWKNSISHYGRFDLTISNLMRAFHTGLVTPQTHKGYNMVDVTLSDEEFKLVYSRLEDIVPQQDIYLWMMLCGWESAHDRHFFSRLNHVKEMVNKFDGSDIIHFLHSGEKNINAVRAYYRAGISYEQAEPFFEVGVRGARDIKAYSASGIPAEVIALFLAAGIRDIKHIRTAVDSGIDPSLMVSLVAA